MTAAAPATLDELRSGGKAALARALAAAESSPDDKAVVALLDEAHADPRAHVIGLTGPPGVGKSTLTNALLARWRKGRLARRRAAQGQDWLADAIRHAYGVEGLAAARARLTQGRGGRPFARERAIKTELSRRLAR